MQQLDSPFRLKREQKTIFLLLSLTGVDGKLCPRERREKRGEKGRGRAVRAADVNDEFVLLCFCDCENQNGDYPT